MRTTLSLDDDVMIAVKERARRERRSAGEVLSDLARQALTQGRGSEEGSEGSCTGTAGSVTFDRSVSLTAVSGATEANLTVL